MNIKVIFIQFISLLYCVLPQFLYAQSKSFGDMIGLLSDNSNLLMQLGHPSKETNEAFEIANAKDWFTEYCTEQCQIYHECYGLIPVQQYVSYLRQIQFSDSMKLRFQYNTAGPSNIKEKQYYLLPIQKVIYGNEGKLCTLKMEAEFITDKKEVKLNRLVLSSPYSIEEQAKQELCQTLKCQQLSHYSPHNTLKDMWHIPKTELTERIREQMKLYQTYQNEYVLVNTTMEKREVLKKKILTLFDTDATIDWQTTVDNQTRESKYNIIDYLNELRVLKARTKDEINALEPIIEEVLKEQGKNRYTCKVKYLNQKEKDSDYVVKFGVYDVITNGKIAKAIKITSISISTTLFVEK